MCVDTEELCDARSATRDRRNIREGFRMASSSLEINLEKMEFKVNQLTLRNLDICK